jgi:hypothetical protein
MLFVGRCRLGHTFGKRKRQTVTKSYCWNLEELLWLGREGVWNAELQTRFLFCFNVIDRQQRAAAAGSSSGQQQRAAAAGSSSSRRRQRK